MPRSDTFGFAVSSEKWLPLPKMPYPRTRPAAAVHTGQLFLVSGAEGTLFHFNPLRQRKANLPSCSHISFTLHKEEIYMISGRDSDLHPVNNVKKYSRKSNKWKDLSPMGLPHAAHCEVLLEHVIYVIVGSSDHACLNSMVCYKPSNDQWEQGPDMISA